MSGKDKVVWMALAMAAALTGGIWAFVQAGPWWIWAIVALSAYSGAYRALLKQEADRAVLDLRDEAKKKDRD